jgi:predicted ABC-type transport system involved in lysophospholipase L1 biosynthesis ATPase subunit
MIEINDLEGVNFRLAAASIPAGELAAVVAPSEPCAREFVDLLLGLAQPLKGSVRLLDREVASLDEPARLAFRGAVGFAARDQGLVGHLALWENILLGVGYHRGFAADRVDERVRTMLGWCGWPEDDARRAFLLLPEQASPFERSGAAWLRAALGEPELLVCEDLFGGLAPDERRRLLGASVTFQSERPSRGSVFVLVNDRLLEEIQPTSVLYLSRGGDFRAET